MGYRMPQSEQIDHGRNRQSVSGFLLSVYDLPKLIFGLRLHNNWQHSNLYCWQAGILGTGALHPDPIVWIP